MVYGPNQKPYTEWVFSSWTPNYDIYLCFKGFVIEQFDTHKDMDFALNEEPRFWGRVRLFITPWFSNFDATNMVVTTLLVWIRLPNLPLPFWHNQVL